MYIWTGANIQAQALSAHLETDVHCTVVLLTAYGWRDSYTLTSVCMQAQSPRSTPVNIHILQENFVFIASRERGSHAVATEYLDAWGLSAPGKQSEAPSERMQPKGPCRHYLRHSYGRQITTAAHVFILCRFSAQYISPTFIGLILWKLTSSPSRVAE